MCRGRRLLPRRWECSEHTGLAGMRAMAREHYGGRITPTRRDATGLGAANAGGYLCEAGAAMQVVYNWLLNARPQGNCNGPAYPLVGVWSCLFTQAGTGEVVEVVWDSSQTCSGGSCTTSTYTPSTGYTHYSNLAGQTGTISGGTVQIGAKPILLN